MDDSKKAERIHNAEEFKIDIVKLASGLKFARRRLGYTQKDLSEATARCEGVRRVAISTVRNLENERIEDPRRQTIFALAKTMGMPCSELLGDSRADEWCAGEGVIDPGIWLRISLEEGEELSEEDVEQINSILNSVVKSIRKRKRES